MPDTGSNPGGKPRPTPPPPSDPPSGGRMAPSEDKTKIKVKPKKSK